VINEAAIQLAANVTFRNGVMNGQGGGIITINKSGNFRLENSTINGGGAQYWSAAIQCRTGSQGVVLENVTVNSSSFPYYGYAPGDGCTGLKIIGGEYNAGNADAIMCRRCPAVEIIGATLNGDFRSHASNAGDMKLTDVTLNGGLDFRNQERKSGANGGLTQSRIIATGGNIPWNCHGNQPNFCHRVVYQ
jgi:hypothetical protein